VPVDIVDIVDRVVTDDAGIVDQHIDTSVPRSYVAHLGVDAVGIGDVDSMGGAGGAVLLLQGVTPDARSPRYTVGAAAKSVILKSARVDPVIAGEKPPCSRTVGIPAASGRSP